jgi:hypothetical protein
MVRSGSGNAIIFFVIDLELIKKMYTWTTPVYAHYRRF